jgi:hypothetical protein
MNNKIKKLFKILFIITGFIGIILGLLLMIYSLYNSYNLTGIGLNLYNLIFGSIITGSYFMQRVPSYIMGIFYIIYGILSFLSIVLLLKKNKLTRGFGMACCTFGLVAILLSRPIRSEIFYIVIFIWIFELLFLVLFWNKIKFSEDKNSIIN